MARKWREVLACLIVILCLVSAVLPLEPPDARVLRPKVLMIGIDGCRPDALKAAETPHLDRLIQAGAYSDQAQTGPRTKSGPGWSSMLTGVTDTKHGVRDNNFWAPRFKLYPHLFQRLKEQRPGAVCVSIVHWEPIHAKIVTAADHSSAPKNDDQVEREACQWVKDKDPDWLFVHFDDVDGAGHGHGFSSTEPRYLAAIEKADERVGNLLAALRQRATNAREDWLILVSTDHGGKGKDHGADTPDERTIFVLVSGGAAQPGKIEPAPKIWDVGVTALRHLQVEPKKEWDLDGQAVGLKSH